jgi:basic membrane protein A and related proteins
MRSRMIAAGLAAAAAAVAIGCGSSSDGGDGGGTGTAGGSSGAAKVAMVLPGPINDKGYNQTGYAGLELCGREGLKTSYTEKVAVPDFVKSFETAARTNDVVIGHGFEFGEIAAQVAPRFPKVKFLVTANPLRPEGENVMHMTLNSTQGAYMAGALAGLTSESGKVGGIAGYDFPVLKAQMAAFEAGLRQTDADATFKVVYLGTMDDVAKGKEAARSMAASGVDVVYHIADAAGVGVITGAEAAGIKAIGWGFDQNSIAPRTVIGSQLANMSEQIGRVCKAIADGRFEGGTVEADGLTSGLTGLSPLYNVGDDVQPKLDEIRDQIIAGDLEVPSIGGDVPGSGPDAG